MVYVVKDLGFVFGIYSDELSANARAEELSSITEAPIFIEAIHAGYRNGVPIVKEEPVKSEINGQETYDWSPKARARAEAQFNNKPVDAEIVKEIEATQE